MFRITPSHRGRLCKPVSTSIATESTATKSAATESTTPTSTATKWLVATLMIVSTAAALGGVTTVSGAASERVPFAMSPTQIPFLDNGQTNEEIPRTDARVLGWATGVFDFERGWVNYQNPEAGRVSFGEPTDALGANGTPFSLGDGGWITFSFDAPIGNSGGVDFAIFENGFEAAGGVYMELGFVEVSTNGSDFVRLPNLARRETQPGPFDASPSESFYNLAGNFVGGTGIDLDDLLIDPDPRVLDGTIDLGHIYYVRVRDVIGDIKGPGTTFDTLGRAVADPYPTAFGSGGMDITGVAVLNPPTPSAVNDDPPNLSGQTEDRTIAAYPNPFRGSIRLEWNAPRNENPRTTRYLNSLEILDAQGRRVARLSTSATNQFLDWNGRDAHGRELPQGVYYVRAAHGQATYTTAIRKVE